MGCTSSSSVNTPGKPSAKAAAALAAQKKKREAMEVVDVSPDDSDKIREDLLQRKDSEADLSKTIQEERANLKAMSSKKIIRKLSFEDLVDSLTKDDYEKLSSKDFCFKIQKEFRIRSLKRDLAERKKSWVVFNNLEAISDFELTILGVYFMSLIKALNGNTDKITLPPPKKGFHSSADIFKKSFQKSINAATVEVPSGGGGQAPVTSGPYLLKMEEHLRDLPVVTIAPWSHYQVSHHTLYDYELPPGLITMNEAISLIELFRRGGRLNHRSMHKLLRLGYKHLKQQQNITPMTITEKDKLIVVGDIHGQLADLLHILFAAGLPSNHTKYIFNGDFVDRGDWGVEVMSILLCLMIARPDCVVLNRGNHEDFAICSVYGFQLECYEKYDPLTFSLFVEVFQQIPLFALINDIVFVVHGGLFHNHDITLEDLNRIDRTVFTLEDLPENGESLDPPSRWNPKEFYKQLTRDALWSDPTEVEGLHESVRGAGVAFGPDITRNFLAYNQLKMVIRSHECIRSGYDEPYTAETADLTTAPILCTIFSASDYGGSGNSAAYMEFHLAAPDVSEDQVQLEFARARSESAESVDSNGSLKRRHAFNRPSLSIKHTSDLPSPILASTSTEDNTGELKHIEGSQLFYKVHYFYAEPLQLGGSEDEAERMTLHHANTINDFLKEGDSNNTHAVQQLLGASSDDVSTASSTTAPPAILLPKDSHDHDDAQNGRARSKRISFGGTTLIMDEEQHDKEQNLVMNTDPTEELLKDRQIVLGSALKIDDLILQRKQLLLEAFERSDPEGKEMISQKDWMRAMFEILNISISWRKLGRYLIREEDRVPVPPPATSTTPTAGSSPPPSSAEVSSESSRSEKMDRLRRAPPSTRAPPGATFGARTDENVAEDHFYIKYKVFLSRYEEEDVKEKRKEQEAFNMAMLKRFQTSNSSLLGAASVSESSLGNQANNPSKESTPSAAATNEEKKNDPNLMSLAEYNRLYGSEKAAEGGSAVMDSSKNDDKHYFGYQIPEYVIASIYSSYKQIEHMFLCLDEDRDGFFNLQDLLKITSTLNLQELLDQEVQSYPMIKNIRFSPDLIMNLMDINRQDCIDMNSFYEIFRLSILNRLYDREGASKPLLARETSYAVELHRLSHSHSLFTSNTTTSSSSGLVSPSIKQSQNQSALSSLELKKGIEISVDNELTMGNKESQENVGLSIDI